jgi:ABC-type branched-subunit amino acid transport system substrate-binding protein
VECGLAIVAGAGARSAETGIPVRVGIGIHAGETVETSDGYVGGAVNIAARICAQARAGEVLVSDTVRALTQSVVAVRYEARGRRALKGVAEPVALYAAIPASAAVPVPTIPARLRNHPVLAVAAGVVALALVAGAGWAATRGHAGLPAGTWKIGVDLPLSGDNAGRGQPILAAVQMAIDDANGANGALRALPGTTLALDVQDDNGREPQDPSKGAANLDTLVRDAAVVGVVGPTSSRVAMAEIPVSNQGGLLQCSPATTNAMLTKPRAGALDLRSAFPNRINFVRLATGDDLQGPAAASLAFHDLGATDALVVSDGTQFGQEITASFTTAFTASGGKVTSRSMNADASDVESALKPLDPSIGKWVVYFGGDSTTGAPQLRAAMARHGWANVPFVGSDGILDGSGADDQTFIQQAGPAAAQSYATSPSIAPVRHDFALRYQERFGHEPDEFSAAGYACVQVIVQSLAAVAANGPSAADLREAVRSYATVPGRAVFNTVLGSVGFDANGDSLSQFVAFYRVDPTAAGGKGDWVLDKEQDFGPAP